jgi:LCP family protein required for cell wall assembly
MFLVAASVVAYRTMSAIDEVQSISTPPPEISGVILGGADDLVIDTGPAQRAVLDDSERQQQASSGESAEPTGPNQPSQFQGLTPGADQDQDPDDPDPADNGSDSGSATSGGIPPGTDNRLDPTAVDDSGPTANNAPATSPDSEEGAASDDESGPAATVVPSASSGTNILLMGVDARDNESIDVGVRPDSLAVLNLNEETGSCRILAVPRDSRANLPGYGQSKINHALAVGGIPYETLVVEDYLGIEIEHYVLVDFAGLVQVVDAVGGVVVDNPEAFSIGATTFSAGSIPLDGEQALSYSRYRGGSDGDFGRISRQQQVVRGLMDEVYDVNLVRLVPSMFSLLSDHFRTDYGATDLVGLTDAYRTTCTSDTIETRTVPGDVQMAFDGLMQLDLSFVISDPATVRDNVEWLLGQE